MQRQTREDLELLAIKLSRVQTDFERARSRGDADNVARSLLQVSAITSERDRIIRHLAEAVAGNAARLGR